MGKSNNTQWQQVLDYHRKQGLYGATCDECEVATGIIHQACSPLIQKMVKAGVLVYINVYRRTRRGDLAQVTVLAEFAKVAKPKDEFC